MYETQLTEAPAGRWRWVLWYDNELVNQGDERTVEQAALMAAASIVSYAQSLKIGEMQAVSDVEP